MVTFLIILLIIACVALGLFVLIQNPKGGGLATGGGGSNMFGVQRTGDVLEKGSWVLLTLIVVLTLAVTTIAKTSGGSAAVGNSAIQERLDKTPSPSPLGGNLNSTKPAASTPAKTDSTKK
ncbi:MULTISPECIES: preprotein translocase subunit SecG [unclassified Pedobacter]|jgi:preprotein translocase subunit SecG|uniref:preprotein translocase subunit SecG n=1 Tax=unclassified Pedobacter TaxID=2628915 RepID=UPI001044CB1E|nr:MULTISPECIES: preprotein translocase subunit SecG [unclassified Pedobacter]MBE5317943.1 preprotein translocase subunit SecG [Pedobacter sp. MR2016-19]QDW27434.1 preprotein translocase subunit SecG [Pedobacter sp. KBS0701]QXU41251.1 preprotein translocase subunit SecG [Pedobacter sp. D749]